MVKNRPTLKPNSHHDLWKNELDAFHLYGELIHIEKNKKQSDLFKELSQESIEQATYWKIKANHESVKWIYKKDLRLKIVILMLKFFGPARMLQTLSAMKVRGLSTYRVGFVHSNEDNLKKENLHAAVNSGTNFRAMVFGINDGLVSNASLVFGVVGSGANSQFIFLTGLAGLLAGAFSMAVGEYISVKSQTELYENQISLEADELNEFPEEEAKELSLIYQAKGLDLKIANELAQKLIADKDKALDTLTREELGLNPEELGNPLGAGVSSFISFTIGAIIPIIPFLIFEKDLAFKISAPLSALGLFVAGMTTGLFTGKSALYCGARITLFGTIAAVATYLVGNLIGVSVN